MSNAPGRLNYLDQFRGYTVVGMIAVNYLGRFSETIHPVFLHHNTYCSYADTIMPQFFFAVGFALRYTMVRRLVSDGWAVAHWRIVRRVASLLLVAALVHGFDRINLSWNELCEKGIWYWFIHATQREFFQTLTHIAVTTLWLLPVIGMSWPVRLLWLMVSAVLHIVLSHEFWLKFALERPVIDGGPLGFLTWTIPVLVGSFACDFLTTRNGQNPNNPRALLWLTIWSVAIMSLGYGISCLTVGTPAAEKGIVQYTALPFVPPWEHGNDPKKAVNLWTMSQRTGSVSYLTFGAGISLLVLALCIAVFGQDRQIGLFRTLGSNALAAYIVQGIAIDAVHKLLPRNAALWAVLLGGIIVLGITLLICRYLEKRGWYLRL